MKRVFSIGSPLLLLIGYLALLCIPIPTSSGSLPPLGKFLNPFSGFWQNAEGPSATKDVSVGGLGLSTTSSVCFDDRLVPHIFAGSDEDLMFIQGYLHARYRLWQLDITARQSSGRLSEVFGEALLENDQRMRRIGLGVTAKKYAENWAGCADYPLLQKYVEGVNHWIENLAAKDYPLEFKLFNYCPEPWTIEKTALVVMSMNLMLCARNEDIAATNTLSALGDSTFRDLFPSWNPRQSPVIPSEKIWSPVKDLGTNSPPGHLNPIKQKWIHDAPRYIGSNNWAVNGNKTAEGFPILCNDPHLGLSLPAIWYEMQVTSPTTNAYGVSLPGIPNLAIGFNEDIAWGLTNVGIDVSDLYAIQWTDDTQSHYWVDGDTVAIEMRIEEYQIKSAGVRKDTVRITQWGPVFFENDQSLALKWVPNIKTDNCILHSFRQLSTASNFEDYYASLKEFASPAQNFAFASREGDLALKVQGSIPIKPIGEGQFIMQGNTSANDWKGFIPFDETPFIKNPRRNFIASANQNSTDTTYPYKYKGYFDDYRGRTLNTTLAGMEDITVMDMKNLQNSNYDQAAADLCPILLGLIREPEAAGSWYQKLSAWDHTFEPESPEPVFFELWKNQMLKLIWDELAAVESEGSEVSYPELWRTIEILDLDPSNILFDIAETTPIETAHDLAIQSFQSSVHQYDSLSDGASTLTWSQYRPIQIRHLSRIPAFSKNNVQTGGTATALNATKPTHGPSWRMVVQLSDPVQAWGIYPGGQSGNPGSAYYANMVDDWAEGKYYPLHFAKERDDLEDVILFKLNLQ